MGSKQRETGIFIQNTPPEVHFWDSLFVAEFSVKPCNSATKSTKKLLASVSTFASREFVLVEVRGVEPLSWSTPKQISTCLVSTYWLIVTLALPPDLAAKLTIPSCKSRRLPKVSATSQNALWHPVCLSILQAADVAVKLRSQCVLFVRNYCFDRCFTRPTIILDMQSTPNAANRIRYTPEILWLLI